ncbi:MAG TPA: pyruvate:ferredoxin (flavodoxin) oxidoreductase [Thermoanaerobaculia bacterium]|nr:pyruvate:ferredoxin (flavodoxin) oxidoreductase [Thermoanaerobaculia bacterium]HPA50250.1 pyruvate:ferredoxin (flavodoxin) oxidoreductase [Thermoanaerobaculia bacterium]HQN06568.1 pyruvate:ferredoxin (flavodoxin) oxidoreductase [Thermoanaerobaculia bacterium]HQP85236.1 pyruvate:ferredoxin (flavodoxin) oxidoreductase [Thermoanaerobaculia bacterium]
MTTRPMVTLDGNEAVASVAHRVSEVIAIYPITPSSTMGEFSDEWSALGRKNVWGTVPLVSELQSEGGAAGAVHGALQAGALTTTFTASQGLLLMIPNMYKIAGELTPFVMHVSARCVATHALSIFGDHSDVMACRQTGFAMLASSNPQEAHDLAAIAHRATLMAKVPFLHFFDGFRTSSEVAKIELLGNDDLLAMVSEDLVSAQRKRALTPEAPVLRGSAQNPDCFFQAREACNPYYDACAGKVQEAMDAFAKLTGRAYRLFDYFGHPEAERVIVLMGSGADVTHETVEYLLARGEKVGVVKVRLYRPFDASAFLGAVPKTAKAIAVLDRTKEPGSVGEPLFQDVVTVMRNAREDGTSPFAVEPKVVGGRYGLASKDFTPAMVKGVFDELKGAKPKRGFTVGIVDDVTHLSLKWDPDFDTEGDDVTRGVFFGLGADGTVGANKNSIKIIGEETDNYAQGYFVYDSKKSGGITISHLRFGPKPIRSSYLVKTAGFVACHQFGFLEKYDVLEYAKPGAVFLLNSPYGPDEVWDKLPVEVQSEILEKKIRFYVIDGYEVGAKTGMGRRINTVMQTCFFAISGVLPREEAIAQIKKSIEKTYGKKGAELVRMNFEAVDQTLENLHEVKVPAAATSKLKRPPIVPEEAPDFVQKITAVMLSNKGDLLPVSAFPVDGTFATATARWEKRNIAIEIPVWDEKLCIQCNKCAMVCPHAAIRAKVFDPAVLEKAPGTYKSVDYRAPEFKGMKYTIQVAPEDCTGCTLCAAVCPAKDKANPKHKALDMAPQAPLRQAERENFKFFLGLPEPDRTKLKVDVKGSQFMQPLFEFSGACLGCGETPYIKLMTQLYGDRLLIANATGCSSIYGGNLPTTPYTVNSEGRGPAWANSLFEDNAEFGFGMRLALDKHAEHAAELVKELSGLVGDELVSSLLTADQSTEQGIAHQRERVAALKAKLAGQKGLPARRLTDIADYLVKKSLWIVGGDGWAYDIGYGGLDHVIAMGRNVNILVLDTEVYSNTGGQASKSTPIGAVAKFAMAGKSAGKKDLAMMAIAYGNVYVAKIAFGAKDAQTVKAFQEAESYDGPSLLIAYSHCIAHGYDLSLGLEQQKLASESGYWPLFRWDPRRVAEGKPGLVLDSSAPKTDVGRFMANETRFRMLEKTNPERAKMLLDLERHEVASRWAIYENLARGADPVTAVAAAQTTPKAN